ncbi:MAG: cysteine hydrolase [Armatimonadetes bacterium]|nr:cysteine hydrolase [Armatimonadota bacterium]
MKLTAHYYRQFDADHTRNVPAESYGGWQTAEVDLSRAHTALVVMHAWDTGTPETYPGWWRAVEYMPRAQAILRDVFPPLLAAAREMGFRVFHVVGGGDYYRSLPGHAFTRSVAGPAPPALDHVEADDSLRRLREFRSANVFVGKHNEADVARGFGALDFPDEARPLDDEPIAENGHELFALCRHFGVNHLIYAGFAINWCLLLSPGGMHEMSGRGVMCSALRQAVTAVENKETARDELCKQIALWRVALAFGFVFDVDEFVGALRAGA